LLEISKEIKDVSVYSTDKAEYANVTKLSDLKNTDHYIIVNNSSLYVVQSLDETEAEKFEKQYSKNATLFEKMGLPFIQRKILLNYLRRVDLLNHDKFGSRPFADQQGKKDGYSKDVVVQNLLEGIINNKNQQIENEEALLQTYFE